jgi:type IV pilus assembly protein PilC
MSFARARSGGKTIAASGELRFRWAGRRADGARRRGTLVAFDHAGARAALRQRGIIVLTLEMRGPAKPPKTRGADITRFARESADLLAAGLPLVQALALLARGHGPMARVAGGLARAITGGDSLGAALARYPQQFDAMFRQLVGIGEASGGLAGVLAHLAEARERMAALRARVRSALTYPAVVLLFAFGITWALLIWVVPTFEQIFAGFGATLPLPTRVVLALSAACRAWGTPALAASAVSMAALAAGARHRPAWRLAWAELLARLPVARSVTRALAATRWCRALGTLLHAGTPLADSFAALAGASGNPRFERAGAEIAARLHRGERLAAAMRATRCFPDDIVETLAVAEETGALDRMLLDLAAAGERRLETRLSTLAALAEPLMIAVLGLLIGVLVVALYLPIIELGSVV